MYFIGVAQITCIGNNIAGDSDALACRITGAAGEVVSGNPLRAIPFKYVPKGKISRLHVRKRVECGGIRDGARRKGKRHGFKFFSPQFYETVATGRVDFHFHEFGVGCPCNGRKTAKIDLPAPNLKGNESKFIRHRSMLFSVNLVSGCCIFSNRKTHGDRLSGQYSTIGVSDNALV